MGPVFWLMLLGAGNAVHVGTFSSMPACQAAANASLHYLPPGSQNPGWTAGAASFLCVEASDAKSKPPA